MANMVKGRKDQESNNDALCALINSALGYPKKGVHVGGGRHVVVPAAWDGTGATPAGWRKGAVSNWVASASDSLVPITDEAAAEIQAALPTSGLSAGQQQNVTNAIAARVSVDTEPGTYTPKG